jgi:hypothetical protein
MADADLDKRFNKAVWLIRNGPKANSSNETCVHGRCMTSWQSQLASQVTLLQDAWLTLRAAQCRKLLYYSYYKQATEGDVTVGVIIMSSWVRTSDMHDVALQPGCTHPWNMLLQSEGSGRKRAPCYKHRNVRTLQACRVLSRGRCSWRRVPSGTPGTRSRALAQRTPSARLVQLASSATTTITEAEGILWACP